MMLRIISTLCILCLKAYASEYYVSPSGNDSNIGNIDKPFKTIQFAVDKLKPGDTCYVREGIYKECVKLNISGNNDNPIKIKSYKNETVILDGTSQIQGKWDLYKNNIFHTKINHTIDQLFINNEMMIEARWPNMSFKQIFNKSCWAKTDSGSTHGKLFSSEISRTGVDWTGAIACLNVAHQWWTWNRSILKNTLGSSELYYKPNLVGLCGYDPILNKPWINEHWVHNSFYLFGKLEALDTETEWYQDRNTDDLYLYAPNGVDPSALNVRYKVRDYAIYGYNINYIIISGFNFFADTFRLDNCNFCRIENCELLFPTYSRTITEYDEVRKESIITKISGDHNKVYHCSIGYSNTLGLLMMGNYNIVENCIIHDINWFGTLIYPALQLSASEKLGVNWFSTIQYPPTERTIENSDTTSYGNMAIHNTLYNCGSSILVYQAADTIIEYNHVYNGGLLSKDVSLIYGCWPFSRGSVVAYNWVHGCRTEGYSGVGSPGGIGIRADDQSRHNIFHHNVVWDCGLAGIIMKGEDHKVYNNTIFDIGTDQVPQIDILIANEAEPYKQWAIRWPLLANQNVYTLVYNNLSRNITNKHDISSLVQNSDKIYGNLRDQNIRSYLKDPEKLNFSLYTTKAKNSSNFTDFDKIKDNLGAYNSNTERWTAGADWKENYSYSRY
jgi:Right handed beta helix region/Chondroitinase B